MRSWSVEIRSGNWGICQGDRHWLLLLPPVFWAPSYCSLINKQSMLAVMQKSGRGCNIYCLEFACGNRRSWYQPDVPSPSSYWPDTAWWPNLRPRSGLLRAAWPRPRVCVCVCGSNEANSWYYPPIGPHTSIQDTLQSVKWTQRENI